MKKKVSLAVIFVLFLFEQNSFALTKDAIVRKTAPKPNAIINSNSSHRLEEYSLDIKDEEKIKIKLTPENKYQKDDLILKNIQLIQDLVSEQQKEEIKDIEMLWDSTVNNNELIAFTMTKLNTPESQKRLHSSIMAKSISALIYGASFLPTFAGADALIQSAAFTTGRLANNYLNKSSVSNDSTLTDTELIQLAGTIEELQDIIISTYYNYKGTLNKLKDIRSKLILYNKNYSNALDNEDEVEIAVSSALYEDTMLEELRLEEEAKKYSLGLERLAGKKAVDNLSLSQYALDNKLFNDNSFKKE